MAWRGTNSWTESSQTQEPRGIGEPFQLARKLPTSLMEWARLPTAVTMTLTAAPEGRIRQGNIVAQQLADKREGIIDETPRGVGAAADDVRDRAEDVAQDVEHGLDDVLQQAADVHLDVVER